MALALSMREHMRLKYAPKADWLLRRTAAASRNAWAARLTTRFVLPFMTLPPVILVPGHKPNQLVKCPTVAKRDISAPVSQITASAVLTSMPSMRVKSTPHILNSCVRRSNLGALRARPRCLPLAGSPW